MGVLGILLALAQTLSSQAGPPETISTIEPGTAQRVVVTASDRFAGTATLGNAVSYAFEVDPLDLIAPDWFNEVRYDFHVKAAARDQDVRPVFRQALVEKFSLVFHSEKRFADAWVMRSPPGPPPSSLRTPVSTIPKRRLEARVDSPYPRIVCQECDIEGVAGILKRILGSHVLDDTDYPGFYEFDITWKRDDLDSMFRVWRDEAGIEIVRESRMMDVLVIDAAVRPQELEKIEPTPLWPCEARPAIRKEIASLPPADTLSLTDEERMAPRQDLARKYPYDVFVQMQAQDGLRPQAEG